MTNPVMNQLVKLPGVLASAVLAATLLLVPTPAAQANGGGDECDCTVEGPKDPPTDEPDVGPKDPPGNLPHNGSDSDTPAQPLREAECEGLLHANAASAGSDRAVTGYVQNGRDRTTMRVVFAGESAAERRESQGSFLPTAAKNTLRMETERQESLKECFDIIAPAMTQALEERFGADVTAIIAPNAELVFRP